MVLLQISGFQFLTFKALRLSDLGCFLIFLISFSLSVRFTITLLTILPNTVLIGSPDHHILLQQAYYYGATDNPNLILHIKATGTLREWIHANDSENFFILRDLGIKFPFSSFPTFIVFHDIDPGTHITTNTSNTSAGARGVAWQP